MPAPPYFPTGRNPSATPLPATPTVLIVTSDEALPGCLQEAFAPAGLACLVAGSSSAALEWLRQGDDVDLLLVDCSAPALSGQELLLEWQRHSERPVPCMALIGPGQEGLGLELMRAGALDCVIKDPQLPGRLLPLIGRAMQRLAQQRQAEGELQLYRDFFFHAPAGLGISNADGVTTGRVNRAETELQALKDQLAADLAAMNHLHQLSTRLLEATGLKELLEEILEATLTLQKADFGNVQLYNRQSKALEIVAQRGFGPEFLGYFRTVPEGVGSCGLALQRRRRVIIEDTETDPVYAPCRAAAAAAGYRAVQSTPMFSRDGEPLGMLSTHFRQPHRPSERDLRLTDLYVQQAAGLIERQQAEEALRASEARYRALVHATSAAVWRLTPDGERQLSLEGGIVRGHGEPEAQPGDWLSLIHPDDRVRTRETWRQAVETQSFYEIEHRAIAADGSYRYLLSRGVPVRNAKGEVLEWIGASADITSRKQAEVALRQSEERYRRVSESGFINISFFTTDGRIIDANDAFLRLMGVSRHDLAAGLVRWDRLTAPEWLERTHQAIAAFEATGHMLPFEKEYIRPDGSRFWGLVGAAKLEGRSKGVAFVLDITERKRAEEALREREAQLAFAQRIGRIGVWGRDLVSQISFVTPEWCDIVGIRDPALVRSLPDFLALVHPEDRPRVRAANHQIIETGRDMDFELRILHPEHGERWMLVRGRRLPAAGGKGHRLLGVIIDITEQKRTEEALRASEERLRFAAQAAGFGFYELDLVTGQAYRSPEYKALFGLRPNDKFQLDADQVPVYVYPDDRALLREATRESRDPRGPAPRMWSTASCCRTARCAGSWCAAAFPSKVRARHAGPSGLAVSPLTSPSASSWSRKSWRSAGASSAGSVTTCTTTCASGSGACSC